MKSPFSLIKKTADIYAFSFLIIVTSLIIAVTNIYNRPSGDLFVSVYIETVLIDQYSLYDNQTITFEKTTYPILLGDVVLEITNQRMRIEKETSPLNICSAQGWVGTPGLPIICAPNYFMAVIEAPR
jgi:hypothetical protein